MITCKTCKKQKRCTSLCRRVESLLPKDDTGKDSHREVNLDMDAFLAAAEAYSYTAWSHEEPVVKGLSLDLSRLTGKERKALLLRAKGVSQRDGATLMGITRMAFRTLISRAVMKLRVAHLAHLIEGNNNEPVGGKGGY